MSVAIAVIAFLWTGWRPYSAVLGRPNGVEGYHDITRYPDARQIPGLVLFRWDAPLFFANAELFKEHALDAVAKTPSPVRWLVVGQNRSPEWTSPRPMRSPNWTRCCIALALSCVLPTQRSRKGQAQAVRTVARIGEKHSFQPLMPPAETMSKVTL